MPKAIISIDDKTNRVLNIIKAKYGLKDKSQAIDKMAEEYEDVILGSSFQPDFFKTIRLKETETATKIEELLKYYKHLK